jgi:hypothetical protein
MRVKIHLLLIKQRYVNFVALASMILGCQYAINVATDRRAPLQGEFEIEQLSEGHFRFDGPMLNGVRGERGPVACLAQPRNGPLHICVGRLRGYIRK